LLRNPRGFRECGSLGLAKTWQFTEGFGPRATAAALDASWTIIKEGMVLPAMTATTKTVFTTGEAAKICKVSQQTIIRCFDNGSLKGFRVPGSRFRRIPRNELYSFMRDNGIPTDALESGKRKLLIVDDDQELVELMSDAFARDGRFEIRTANNGFDAGMLVKEFRPDLVVLDIMLPDINGKEVCQRVRADDTLEQVKIICISGMVEQDKVADLRAAGADDFMQKPFTVDKLVERACELLDMEKAVLA
jgi:two-component system, OmpR family, response regulator